MKLGIQENGCHCEGEWKNGVRVGAGSISCIQNIVGFFFFRENMAKYWDMTQLGREYILLFSVFSDFNDLTYSCFLPHLSLYPPSMLLPHGVSYPSLIKLCFSIPHFYPCFPFPRNALLCLKKDTQKRTNKKPLFIFHGWNILFRKILESIPIFIAALFIIFKWWR